MAQAVDIDLTREMTSSADELWAVLSDLKRLTSAIELQAPDAGPASVHVHWHGEPSNLFGRMMRGMFQRQIEGNWRKSLEELDTVAGASSGTAA